MVTQKQVLTLHVGYRCTKYIEFHKNYLPVNLSQSIVTYEGLPNAVVESILSRVVSSGTQGNEANHNIDLILSI